MNELAVIEQGAVVARDEITETKIIEYLDASGKTNKLLDSEKKMFINIAREFGLNPFKREIHIVAYGEGEYRTCSIITGYEVYIKRAERTGKLDGWGIKYEGEGNSLKAVVTIYRKDMKYPFSHEVYYSECVQLKKDGKPREVWAKMPRFMTKKVAIGQAFRLCFPDDMGGMPYEESELPLPERNVTPKNDDEGNIHKNPNVTPESGQNLVNQAEQDDKKSDMKSVMETTREIITALNPGKLPYFTDEEKQKEWGIAQHADLTLLKNQHNRLKKELEKRAADYKPIPFEDNTPAMYTVKEPDDEFTNDIPSGMYPQKPAVGGDLDIF
jgi:phage recombination protein Bet